MATSTKAPPATATATPIPTGTAKPTVEPSPTPTPLLTPYAGPFRENGGDYTSAFREGIVVDGALSEWDSVPLLPLTFVQQGDENLEGPEDFAVDAQIAWDAAYLYLAARVIDDIHVQEMRSYEIFNGDGVELWLDIDLPGDFADDSWNNDDYQFGFSPGNFSDSSPEAVIWYPSRLSGGNAQLLVAAQPLESGYTLEAAIPWSLLNMQPLPGMVLGFTVTANDNDIPATAVQQTILMQTTATAWGRPTTFSNLRLQ